MWKQRGVFPFKTHLSSNLNAAETVLPAANLRGKHPLIICRTGTACVFSSLTHQHTSASFARSKSPGPSRHILAALSSLPASASQDICPRSKPLFCHQVTFISTPSHSVYCVRNHPWTSFSHLCNYSEQPLGPNTAQWVWWVRSVGSSHSRYPSAELTSLF